MSLAVLVCFASCGGDTTEASATAKAEAEKILSNAQAQADAIIEAAKKNAAEVSDNTTKELKLYASQALNALKSEVASVITDTIVKNEVSGFTGDTGKLLVTPNNSRKEILKAKITKMYKTTLIFLFFIKRMGLKSYPSGFLFPFLYSLFSFLFIFLCNVIVVTIILFWSDKTFW